jgi:hypothetical protein
MCCMHRWCKCFCACGHGVIGNPLSGSNRAEPIVEIFPDVWRDVVQIRLSAMHLLLSLYTVYSLRIDDACVRAR